MTPTVPAERLGCYLLPGADVDPRDALDEASAAEAAGLHAVWVAEKYDVKDLPTLAGALSATTRSVRIGAGVTHTALRHPLAIASMSQTIQALSNNRFRLGFGRSAAPKWRAAGVPTPTSDHLADMADLLRRLWSGERVTYEGVLGTYPALRISRLADVLPPPLYLAAIGPKTLALAGSRFDGVILHPFLTPEAAAESVATVRTARERAGIDPASLHVVAAVVVAPRGDPERQAAAVARRAERYFASDIVRRALTTVNGWDESAIIRPSAATSARGASQLTVPPSWLTAAAAFGDQAEQRARLSEYLAAGVDELLLHGLTAHELDFVVPSVATA